MKFYVKNDRFEIYENLSVFLMIYFMFSALKENVSKKKKKTQTALEKKVQVQMTYFLQEFILK
jgi:hypothetical protein